MKTNQTRGYIRKITCDEYYKKESKKKYQKFGIWFMRKVIKCNNTGVSRRMIVNFAPKQTNFILHLSRFVERKTGLSICKSGKRENAMYYIMDTFDLDHMESPPKDSRRIHTCMSKKKTNHIGLKSYLEQLPIDDNNDNIDDTQNQDSLEKILLDIYKSIPDLPPCGMYFYKSVL